MKMSAMRMLLAAALAATVLVPAAAQVDAAAQGDILVMSDFEDGTLQGWQGRSTADVKEKLEILDGKGRGGGKALYVSNRKTTWQGPLHPIPGPLVPGDRLALGVWVRYDEGPAKATFVMSMERGYVDPAASHTYANIAQVGVNKGEWTFLGTEYTVPNEPNQKTFDFYVERPYKSDNQVVPDDLISFMIDDASAIKLDPNLKPRAQEDIPSLYEAWESSFSVGAAVMPEELDASNERFKLVKRHFNALTAGNAMKWDALQPKEGQFNWAGADKIVRLASLTGKRMRGHTLVWHSQTPDWVFQDPTDPSKPASKELLKKRLQTHITEVVSHFKGDVECWDVVNEALSDSDGLRKGTEGSKWYQILGPEYIELAFTYARKADPDCVLVYNDYNLESDPRKLAEAVKLVKSLKAKKIPIDAVGLQMHVQLSYPSLLSVKNAISQLAALGVKVQVTELDVSIYSSDSEAKKPVTDAILLQQAQRYKDLFAAFKEAADKGWLDLVVLWGLSDDGSWLNDFPVPGRTNAPLLFDRKLQAKPAFWALVDPAKVQGLR
jgi:endo-1,4-beta-xylanase